jgi:hypothetical protein
MVDTNVLRSIHENTPKYNRHTLIDYMKNELDRAPEFVGAILNEGVKMFNGVITYVGHRVLPPEDRANFELAVYKGCSVHTSELILTEYIFEYDGKKFQSHFYLPYLRNNVITIMDTMHVVQKPITEQVFSKTATGVTVKTIRQPIPFHRNSTFDVRSICGRYASVDYITTLKIHQNPTRSKEKKKTYATCLHYLLCKYGIVETLNRFGLTSEDISIVERVNNDEDIYYYFEAKQHIKKIPMNLYLKVKQHVLLSNKTNLKIVANLLYILTPFTKYKVEDIYDPEKTAFRIMLGKIIHGDTITEASSKNRIDNHIRSVDNALDLITMYRLNAYGYNVKDIYDFLQAVFSNIDTIILESSYTDLFKMRINIVETILVDTICKSVFGRWYYEETNPSRLNEQEVKRILKFDPMLIRNLSSNRIVQKSPQIYGDNQLIPCLCQKTRQSSISQSGKVLKSADHRFNPSAAAVETIYVFNKSNPGAGGIINPYLEIDNNGTIIKPAYSAELDSMKKFIPNN